MIVHKDNVMSFFRAFYTVSIVSKNTSLVSLGQLISPLQYSYLVNLLFQYIFKANDMDIFKYTYIYQVKYAGTAVYDIKVC